MKINGIKALDYQCQGESLTLVLTETDFETVSNLNTAGFTLLLHRLGQLLDQLLTVLVPQQVLNRLSLKAGTLLQRINCSLYILIAVRDKCAALRCGDARNLANSVIPDC